MLNQDDTYKDTWNHQNKVVEVAIPRNSKAGVVKIDMLTYQYGWGDKIRSVKTPINILESDELERPGVGWIF